MRVEVLRDTQAHEAQSAALAGRKRMRSTRALAIPAAVWCSLLLTLAFKTARPVFAVDQTPSEVLVSPTRDSLLSGADWRLGSFAMDEGESRSPFAANFDDHAFRTVAVPGEVQLQIGLKGMDRYYQSRELSLVNTREWWYRKHFVAPADCAGKLNRLVFDGVDYFTTVWLNGDKLGSHEGAYVSFSFDVSSKLKYGSDNVLVLKVTAPWVPRDRGYLEYLKGEWTMSDPSNVMRFPFPPFVLGPYWDGIPAAGNAVFPMGLWRDVHLVTSGSLAISDAFVYTKSLNNDGSATLEISGAIRNYSGETHKAEVKLHISPDTFKAETINLPPQAVTAKPGESTFEVETVVRDPRLWWTWDTGEQNLYRLAVAIDSAGSAGEDHRETVFGIRTISRKDDMSYWLNGKRLFLKGAWYPIADYYGSLPTRTTYQKDLELYRAANLNHLVAFTTVEKPDFYDLCDRLGILDFFEYPFSQFGPEEVLDYSNPRRAEFVRESLSQLRQITIALRNHPSIIEWAPFAEAHEKGGKWGVLDLDLEKYGYGEYSDAIGKMVAELDPGTLYQPSFCDLGEQHFWMANSGMGTEGGYNEHFDASTSFVSEYGSIALPALETLRKILTPDELWSDHNATLPRWYHLPIDTAAYAYQTSFEYNGLAGVLDRVNNYVDRNIRSPQELVDDSQLYQAFIFKYATEAYRRKKYHPVNGTRIWAYGEVTPGIRFNFLDYYRVPKMGYYYLKSAQQRFAVSLAYEEALESQVAGTSLKIPVWAVNDYPRPVSVNLHCEIRDSGGGRVWTKDSSAAVEADASAHIDTVDWVTPSKPGVYALSAQASEKAGPILASTSAFIKVTPALFSRAHNVLVIGDRKFAYPVAQMLRAMGLSVTEMYEQNFPAFAQLGSSSAIRQKYDLVWLTSADSIWKLLDDNEAEALRDAIRDGVGFIHTGGSGSFHGGFGRGAGLDFTALADVLPVTLKPRNDVIFDQIEGPEADIAQKFRPIKSIGTGRQAGADGNAFGLAQFGVPGFNDVEAKSDGDVRLTISGRPLLVTGHFGKGYTAVFTGFTPVYSPRTATWDPRVEFPYLVDQEFSSRPVTKSYFSVFMRMVAAALGETPAADYDALLAARDKPLFQTLKELPPADVEFTGATKPVVTGREATFSVTLSSHGGYARLVRLGDHWDVHTERAPYLALYGDNYFDIPEGGQKTVEIKLFLPGGHPGEVSGSLEMFGTNAQPKSMPIRFSH